MDQQSYTVPSIPEAITRRIQGRIKAYPCHSNRASSIGAVCLRQLVYQRLHWDQATLPSVDAKRVFELGDDVEQRVVRALQDAGYEVIEQQRPLDDFKDLQLTGHVDGVLLLPEGAIPFDVKSMNPYIWQGLFPRGEGVYEWSEVAEGFESKSWLRKYRAQIQLYALGKSAPYGILLCSNKSTAELAQVVCPLDFDYCDFLLKRCAEINGYVERKELPDRIPWDDEECPRCAWLHMCLPDRVGKDPVIFLPDSEIARLCVVRESAADQAKAYDDADAKIKAWAKGQEGDRHLVQSDSDVFEITRSVGKKATRVNIRRFLSCEVGAGAVPAPTVSTQEDGA